MEKRRQFLQSVAGTMALVSVGSTVAAKSKEDLHGEIVEAFREGRSEGVEELLDNKGVNHLTSTTKSTHVIEDEDEEDDSAISPEWAYSEAESEMNMVAIERSEPNRLLLTVHMALEGPESLWTRDVRFVDDVIGIGYDENEWTGIGSPNVTAVSSTSGATSAEFFTGSVDGGGLPAVADIEATADGPPDEAIITIQTDLETDGSPGTLWGYYEHTKGTNSDYIDSIGMGAGPFDVSLSGLGATTEWEEVDNIDPEPYL